MLSARVDTLFPVSGFHASEAAVICQPRLLLPRFGTRKAFGAGVRPRGLCDPCDIRKEFLDDIAVSLGGYVAEEMVFSDLTTGPSNDLQVLTALARDMVTKYGMSDIGPVALEGEGGKALFGRGAGEKEYSPEVAAKIDAEVKSIIDEAFAKARKILTDNRKLLDTIATRLMEVEAIERDEYEQILVANGIKLKEKEDIEHQV